MNAEVVVVALFASSILSEAQSWRKQNMTHQCSHERAPASAQASAHASVHKSAHKSGLSLRYNPIQRLPLECSRECSRGCPRKCTRSGLVVCHLVCFHLRCSLAIFEFMKSIKRAENNIHRPALSGGMDWWRMEWPFSRVRKIFFRGRIFQENPWNSADFCQISGSEIWKFRARKIEIPYPQPFHTPTRLPPNIQGMIFIIIKSCQRVREILPSAVCKLRALCRNAHISGDYQMICLPSQQGKLPTEKKIWRIIWRDR